MLGASLDVFALNVLYLEITGPKERLLCASPLCSEKRLICMILNPDFECVPRSEFFRSMIALSHLMSSLDIQDIGHHSKLLEFFFP